MNLILLGPPGVGKGTHAKLFTHELGIPQISTGDMLRQNIREGTELGKQAKKFIDAGELVPDEVVIGMVRERLKQPDALKGYILDGFPRTVAQAEALAAFTRLSHVINLVAGEETIMEHLSGRRVCSQCSSTFHTRNLGGKMICPSCGGELIHRNDDRPDTIATRLEVYRRQTEPLIAYYREKGLLKDVVVEKGLELDHQAVREAMGLR